MTPDRDQLTALRERVERLESALRQSLAVAHEARVHWDEAPEGMKAGKLLIALSGMLPGYRKDIDEIHDALANKPSRMSEERQ